MTPEDLVKEVGSLFSLPEAALRVNELIDTPTATLQDIAEVVQLDAGLASAVLRLANSAYYGLPSKVGMVSLAITLIGQKALRDIVLSVSVTRAFKGLPEDLVDMHAFWQNSTTCGVIARNLARLAGERDGESLFLAGLLHAVGKLVFYARRPVHYREILARQPQNQSEFVAEERRMFGFSYAELGAALLKSWRLPALLVTTTAYQLEPLKAPAFRKEAAILHVAQDMAASLAPHLLPSETLPDYTPGFDPAAWVSLGLEAEVLPEVRGSSLLQALEILEIIHPRATLIY